MGMDSVWQILTLQKHKTTLYNAQGSSSIRITGIPTKKLEAEWNPYGPGIEIIEVSKIPERLVSALPHSCGETNVKRRAATAVP